GSLKGNFTRGSHGGLRHRPFCHRRRSGRRISSSEPNLRIRLHVPVVHLCFRRRLRRYRLRICTQGFSASYGFLWC
ncbi:unnamed protein product, partial [Prunus brigantina]